jgi:hypothetical protein
MRVQAGGVLSGDRLLVSCTAGFSFPPGGWYSIGKGRWQAPPLRH